MAMSRQHTATSAVKISRLNNTIGTVSDTTGRSDIGHTASHAALWAAESIGRVQSMRRSFHLVSKLVNSATRKSRLISFTQTDVLPTALKNTGLGAKVAFLKKQKPINRFCIKEKLKEGPHRQRCSLLRFSTTRPNASKALGLTSILDTFFGFMKANPAFVLFRGSR